MNKQVFIRALKIALVVGMILNIINQGEFLLTLSFEEVNYYKFFITFLVPFSVSIYTAIMMKPKVKT